MSWIWSSSIPSTAALILTNDQRVPFQPEIRLPSHFKALCFPTKKGILFSAPGHGFLQSLGKPRCPHPTVWGTICSHSPGTEARGWFRTKPGQAPNKANIVTLPGFLMHQGCLLPAHLCCPVILSSSKPSDVCIFVMGFLTYFSHKKRLFAFLSRGRENLINC